MQAGGKKNTLQPFITLIEDISDPVCIVSLDGAVQFINSAFKKLTNYKSLEEFTHHGGLIKIVGENVYMTIFSSVSNSNTWEGNILLKIKNKPFVSVDVKAKPITDDMGSVMGAAFYFKELSIKSHPEEYLRLLESFIENANDAVMITEAEPIDEPGPRIIYTNPAFTQITGYTKKEILGKSPRILQGPATSREELDKIRKALETRTKITVEIINYTKAGKEFWTEFSIVPVQDENGRVTHFVSIQRETTVRKHTDEILLEKNKALQQALQMNREIFEHSLDIICVLSEEGRFIHVSQASERIWGYTPEELIGQPFSNFVYHEDLDKTIAAAKKTSSEYTLQDFENRYVHKEGRPVPMMWTATWSEDNKFIYAIARDISERKAAEEKIKQSEQLYRSLSQNYPNGTITICDRDFRVIVMEGQELARFHITSDMLAGKSVYEIFGKRKAEYIKEKLSPTFEGQTLSLELHIDDRYYLCTAVPLPKQEIINHILVVTQDITARREAEKKLEESYQEQQRLAARMSAILDALPAQVALVNSQGIIIEVNEAWKSFATQNNLSHSDYGIGYNYIHICDSASGRFSEGALNVSEGIRKVISGEMESFSFEYPCNSPIEEKWFRLVVSPVTQTYPTDVVVMHVDITARKQAEQKLQESEQRYKSLFYNHPDAVCALDLEGNFISVNPVMAKLAQKPAEELLHTSFMRLLDPQDLDQILYYYNKAREGHPQDYEISLTLSTGNEFITHVINIPILVNNMVKGVYSILKDITPTKKAQRLVEETAARLKNILESIGDGFFTVDKNFTVTYWNKMAENMLHIQREEILGRNLWEVFPEAVPKKYYTSYKKAMDENICVHFEEYYDPADLWTEVSVYPSEDGLSIYFRDITERKKAEENLQNYNRQLQKINHELDQFVYRASHDLRAPLVSVLGLINLCYIEKDEAQKIQYLALMEKSIHKLDNFIQDIIYYSKNSRTELILSEVDFPLLISNTIDNLKFMEEAKPIKFYTDIEEIDGFYTDVNRLNVVLHNIVANAIRYHDPSKQQYIRIQVAYIETAHVRIVVEDNGQGIPKEHQSRIFEMFYRATEKRVGSGLGLYIVKENLNKLKGTITLDSEQGRGTTFMIEIPSLSAAEAADKDS